MTAGVQRVAEHSVLGRRLLISLRAAGATPGQVEQAAALLEVPEFWREVGSPCDDHPAECWPARKVDRAADAVHHRVPPKGRTPPGDGPRERHRQYDYRAISVLCKLGLTPAELQLESGMDFDPPTMTDTLRGFTYGAAEQRRVYLRALMLVALRRNYSVSQVIDWFAGWGAPVDNSDPVLYLGANGVARDCLPTNASMVAELEALWPRDEAGRILPRAARLRTKKRRREAKSA